MLPHEGMLPGELLSFRPSCSLFCLKACGGRGGWDNAAPPRSGRAAARSERLRLQAHRPKSVASAGGREGGVPDFCVRRFIELAVR